MDGHLRLVDVRAPAEHFGSLQQLVRGAVGARPGNQLTRESPARRVGVGKVVTCRDGDLVKIAPGEPGIIDEVPAGRLYKDGSILEDSKSRAVVERRRMGFAGCAFRSRCSFVDDRCADLIPDQTAASGHTYLCRLPPTPRKELVSA